MKHLKLSLLLFSLLIIPGLSSPALELYNNDKMELELSLLFSPIYEAHIMSLQNGFYFKGADIELEAEYNERLEFAIELDFSEINKESKALSTKVLENIYLQYNFSKQFKIRMGQFKIPAGEEISIGMTQRPYLDHSIGSKKLMPGTRRGLMISGKNCLSIIGYQAGIFNTSEPDEPINTSPYLSTAGKLFLSFELTRQLDIKTGYSMYYSFDEIFDESLFLSTKLKWDKIHTLTLFSEYMEQRFYHYQWNNSFYLCTSYRFKNFEIYGTGEIYQENVGYADKDDCIQISSGINVYWKKDNLRTGVGYTYTMEYEKNEYEHSLYLMIVWEQ